MGSRITRSVFREQRTRPIDRTRLEDVHQLTVVFLAFIAALASFLHSYLFHPEPGLSFALLALLLIGIFFACPKSITSIPILTSLGLFIIIIIAYFIKSSLEFLKSTLILATLLFATETNSKITQLPLAKSILLWLFYQSFQAGLGFSSEMQRRVTSKEEGITNQESMLVKTMFSLIALMGFYLVFVGQRFLKRHQIRSQTQEPSAPRIPSSMQKLDVIFGVLLLFGTFSVQRQLNQDFSWKLFGMVLAGATVGLALKFSSLDRIYLMVGGLSASVGFLYWVCEGQESMGTVLKIAYGIVLHTMMIDGLRKSSLMICNKEQIKGRLLSGVYFSGYYLSQISGVGEALRGAVPFLPHSLALLAYGALVLLSFKRIRTDYVSVI